MSVDVEGHELEVLRSVDWNATSVDVLILETVRKPLAALLARLGYWNRGGREPNPQNPGHGPRELWIHRRLRWGRPDGVVAGVWHSLFA